MKKRLPILGLCSSLLALSVLSVLDSASAQKLFEEPVACAARWKGVGARHCLGLLYGFVSDLIKSGLGVSGSVRANTEDPAFINREKYKYKLRELYIFIDVISEYYRLLGSPLDELLMLEDVLVRWVRLGRLQ